MIERELTPSFPALFHSLASLTPRCTASALFVTFLFAPEERGNAADDMGGAPDSATAGEDTAE